MGVHRVRGVNSNQGIMVWFAFTSKLVSDGWDYTLQASRFSELSRTEKIGTQHCLLLCPEPFCDCVCDCRFPSTCLTSQPEDMWTALGQVVGPFRDIIQDVNTCSFGAGFTLQCALPIMDKSVVSHTGRLQIFAKLLFLYNR